MKSRIDVKEYGAVGNGVADDTSAIQQALDGGNRTVIIPPGIYKISFALKVDSQTKISADDQAVIRLASHAGTNKDVFLLTNRGNRDIRVEGGIWDGNNENNPRGEEGDQNAYTGAAINFVGVRKLFIRNLTVRNPEAYSIRMCRVENFLVENIRFDHQIIRPNQDGIHMGGCCCSGTIRKLRALTPRTTNDDMVALNADDSTTRVINLGMECGPIRNININDLRADDAYTFVRMLSSKEPIENITITNVSGGCRMNAVNCDRWRFPAGGGNLKNILIQNFSVRKNPGNNHPLIPVHLTFRNLRIENFNRLPDDMRNVPTMEVDTGLQNDIHLEGATGYSDNKKFILPQGGFSLFTLNPKE